MTTLPMKLRVLAESYRRVEAFRARILAAMSEAELTAYRKEKRERLLALPALTQKRRIAQTPRSR